MILLKCLAGKPSFILLVLALSLFSAHVTESVAFEKEGMTNENDDGSSIDEEEYMKEEPNIVKNLLPSVENLLRTEIFRLNHETDNDESATFRKNIDDESTFVNKFLDSIQSSPTGLATDDNLDMFLENKKEGKFHTFIDPLSIGYWRDTERKEEIPSKQSPTDFNNMIDTLATGYNDDQEELDKRGHVNFRGPMDALSSGWKRRHVNFNGPIDALRAGWKKRGHVNFYGPMDALRTGWKREDDNVGGAKTDQDKRGHVNFNGPISPMSSGWGKRGHVNFNGPIDALRPGWNKRGHVNFYGPMDALRPGWNKRGHVNFHGPIDALRAGWKRGHVNFHGPMDALRAGWDKRGHVNFRGPMDALSSGWKRGHVNFNGPLDSMRPGWNKRDDETVEELNVVDHAETEANLSEGR